MLSLISWLVTGLIVGLIARALLPGRQSLGIGLTVVLGIVGAILGGFLSMAFWPTWANDPNVNRMWPGWIMSVIGAMIVLWGYMSMTNRQTTSLSR